jgi:hypothetical protein
MVHFRLPPIPVQQLDWHQAAAAAVLHMVHAIPADVLLPEQMAV